MDGNSPALFMVLMRDIFSAVDGTIDDDEDEDEDEEDGLVSVRITWEQNEDGTWTRRILFLQALPVAPEPSPPPVLNNPIRAIEKLQACWRGRQLRKTHEAALALSMMGMQETP